MKINENEKKESGINGKPFGIGIAVIAAIVLVFIISTRMMPSHPDDKFVPVTQEKVANFIDQRLTELEKMTPAEKWQMKGQTDNTLYRDATPDQKARYSKIMSDAKAPESEDAPQGH